MCHFCVDAYICAVSASSNQPRPPTHPLTHLPTYLPQEWSDDEEWDGEWEEWEAVADDQCDATTCNSNDARPTAATMWTEPPFCPAVQTAPKAQPAFAFFSSAAASKHADLCPAPVSPLLQ